MHVVSLEKKYPCRNEEKCIWRFIDNETIIFSEEGQWIHQLNDLGAEIWNMCDGKLSIAGIINKTCDDFDVKEEAAEADIISFIEELSLKNLIILNEE